MTAQGLEQGAAIRAPWHLWLVGALATIWNAFGVFDFVATQMQLDAYMAEFTAEQLAFFYGFPLWLNVAWGVAVLSALAASLALLLRWKMAVLLYAVALLAMILTSIHNFGFSNGAEIMGSVGLVMSTVIFVISVLLLWYAHAMKRRGVLR